MNRRAAITFPVLGLATLALGYLGVHAKRGSVVAPSPAGELAPSPEGSHDPVASPDGDTTVAQVEPDHGVVDGRHASSIAPASENRKGPTTISAAKSSTTGDGVDDAHVCDADAQKLCPAEWSSQDVGRKLKLVACLTASEDTSAGCRASLERRAVLNAAVNEACRDARSALCAGVVPAPGDDYGNACLWASTSLQADYPACYDALKGQMAAQPG